MANERKNPKSNLSNYYTILFEGGMIIALGILIIAMNVNVGSGGQEKTFTKHQNLFQMKNVQHTEQHQQPAPTTPVVPTAVPNNVVLKNQNIHFNVDITSSQQLPAPPKINHGSKKSKNTHQVFRAVAHPPKMKISYAKFKSKVKYPASCRNAGLEGPVTVQFVVNKKGMPTNIHVVRGIGGGCDQAVVNAVKKYLRFTPGRQQGRPVKVIKNITVMFKLKNQF